MIKTAMLYFVIIVAGGMLSGLTMGVLEERAPNLYQHTYEAQSIR